MGNQALHFWVEFSISLSRNRTHWGFIPVLVVGAPDFGKTSGGDSVRPGTE